MATFGKRKPTADEAMEIEKQKQKKIKLFKKKWAEEVTKFP